MQKSKSSSHVGHFVTKKILRNRSKSQTRSHSPATSSASTVYGKNCAKWTPSDNLMWMSDNGECISLKDTNLQNLSDLEYQYLQRIAKEKIIELNIGIDINLEKDATKSKTRGLLPKKRSMTTSFFDIGSRKEEVYLFGSSLETCIAKDQKYWEKVLQSLSMGAGGGGRRGGGDERGSRNSIASLFRTNASSVLGLSGLTDSTSSVNHKLHESVRSCESLPTNQMTIKPKQKTTRNGNGSGSGTDIKSQVGNKLISKSQCDIRRDDNYSESSLLVNNNNLTDSQLDLNYNNNSNNSKLRVPSFISTCIQYLEDFGLNTVGLFRVSTSKKRVKQLRDEFDKQIMVMVDAYTSPHDVATLLKEFLRDLPEPLINENLYKAFLKTQKIRNRRLQMEAISHLVKLLSVTHRDTLYVLLRFLAKVSANADDICDANGNIEINGNKMDSYNLATVFAPNILRPYNNKTTLSASADYTTSLSSSLSFSTADRKDAGMQQQNMTDAINVVRTLIDHYEEIFRVPAELIHSIYAHMLDTCPAELNLICAQKSQILNDIRAESLPATPTTPSRTQSTTQVTANKPSTNFENKLFTRESVMHLNDATRASALSSSSTSSMIMQPIAMKRSRSTKHSKLLRRQSTPTELSNDYYNDDNLLNDVHDNDDGVEGKIVTASLQISMAFKPRSTLKNTTNDNTKKSNEREEKQQQEKNIKTPAEPASITNIGGAILRSKTEDFERISAINNQKQQKQPTSSTASSTAPLYKRQQLIRSAKTTTTKAKTTTSKIES